MNQINPDTYALTARCPLSDAARLRALAREQGITISLLVAQLVHTAIQDINPSSSDQSWAEHRRKKNTERRRLQDARTQRGDYRKPGWELMPAYIVNRSQKMTL